VRSKIEDPDAATFICESQGLQWSASGGNNVIRVEAFTDSFTGKISGASSMGSPFATFLPATPAPTVTVLRVDTVNAKLTQGQTSPSRTIRRPPASL
jgi:hypothetical protein